MKHFLLYMPFSIISETNVGSAIISSWSFADSRIIISWFEVSCLTFKLSSLLFGRIIDSASHCSCCNAETVIGISKCVCSNCLSVRDFSSGCWRGSLGLRESSWKEEIEFSLSAWTVCWDFSKVELVKDWALCWKQYSPLSTNLWQGRFFLVWPWQRVRKPIWKVRERRMRKEYMV